MVKFTRKNLIKSLESLIMGDIERMCGITIAALSKHKTPFALYLDTKDADDLFAEQWFKQSGLENKLKKLIKPNRAGIYELIEVSFKQGVQDGLLEINKDFIMTQGYRKALNHLVDYNFDLIKNTNRETIDSIRQTLLQGVADGSSQPEIVKRLSEVNLAPINGVTPKMRAKMISRTEVHRAFNNGNINAYKSWGFDKIDIITAQDNRVCSLCLDVADNNPYEMDFSPPLHPFCRCTVAVHIDDFSDSNNELDWNISVLAETP